MVEVGVRELKNKLSSYLSRVARGEHVRVTMRGKPVADIIPAGLNDEIPPELLRMEAEGKITLSRLPKPTEPPPLSKVRGKKSASQMILEEREQDR